MDENYRSDPASEQQREEQMPRRAGIVMMVLALVLILGMLTWFFDQKMGLGENPNRSVSGEIDGGVREVLLRRNPSGHYVATGAINGIPVEFMLDTGATRVSIPGELAARLGLARGAPFTAHTANGTVTAYDTRLGTVDLGIISIDNVAGSINPGFKSDQILLGMSFLRQLELVQKGRTLLLRQLP